MHSENIDFQDHDLGRWNGNILQLAGALARCYVNSQYQTLARALGTPMAGKSKKRKRAEVPVSDVLVQLRALLGTTSFTESSPATAVSQHLVTGFFEDTSDLLVPVAKDTEAIALVPSSTAFLPTMGLEELLAPHVSVVPMDLAEAVPCYFSQLRDRQMIGMLDMALATSTLADVVIPETGLPALFTWMRSHPKEAPAIKRVCNLNIRDLDVKFASIKYYSGKELSLLPVPSNTLPADHLDSLSQHDLQSILSLKPLPIGTWIKFVVKSDEFQNMDIVFATTLLAFLSHNTTSMTKSIWKELTRTLQSTPCIPVKGQAALHLPQDTFLPSHGRSESELVVDLPLIDDRESLLEDHDVDRDAMEVEVDLTQDQDPLSVTMSFLKRLGVRSTPKISALLDFLSNTGYSAKAVVRQLMEQRYEMSDTDMKELRNAAFLPSYNPSEGDPIDESILPKCSPSDLIFLDSWSPSSSTLVLYFPGLKNPSAERDFLSSLGVSDVPPLNDLLKQCQDKTTGKKAFRTFVQQFRSKYSKLYKPRDVKIAFLPCEMQGKSTLSLPSACFSAPSAAFPALHSWVLQELKDADVDPRDLGVYPCPSAASTIEFLHDPSVDDERIVQLMEHLATIPLTAAQTKSLTQMAFIPTKDGGRVKPIEVCLSLKAKTLASGSTKAASGPSKTRKRRAKTKVAEVTETDISGNNDKLSEALELLVLQVDFSPAANTFLERIGVSKYPDAEQLASLLVLKAKLVLAQGHDLYVALLVLLAENYKSMHKSTKSELKASKILLGCRRTDSECAEEGYSAPRLVSAADVVLVDDQRLEQLLKPLVPPPVAGFDDKLEKLYEQMGSQWLSQAVQTINKPSGNERKSPCAQQLEQKIRERVPLLVRTNRGVRASGISASAEKALNSITVVQVKKITQEVSFRGKTEQFHGDLVPPCALEELRRGGLVMSIVPKDSHVDEYFVAECIARYLHRGKVETAQVASLKESLATPLNVLARRGVPVSRLISTQRAVVQKRGADTMDIDDDTVDDTGDDIICLDDAPRKKPRRREPDFSKAANSTSLLKSVLRNKAVQAKHVVTDEDQPEVFEDTSCNPASSLSLERDPCKYSGMPVFWDS